MKLYSPSGNVIFTGTMYVMLAVSLSKNNVSIPNIDVALKSISIVLLSYIVSVGDVTVILGLEVSTTKDTDVLFNVPSVSFA